MHMESKPLNHQGKPTDRNLNFHYDTSKSSTLDLQSTNILNNKLTIQLPLNMNSLSVGHFFFFKSLHYENWCPEYWPWSSITRENWFSLTLRALTWFLDSSPTMVSVCECACVCVCVYVCVCVFVCFLHSELKHLFLSLPPKVLLLNQ